MRARFLAAVERRLTGEGPSLDHALLPVSAHTPVHANGGWSLQREHAAVEVLFPERGDGAIVARDRASALAVSIRLHAGQPSEAELDDGYLVYHNSLGPGTTAFHRPSEDGFEDYVLFERAPAEPELAYSLSLSAEVAGLRLVANTLELLDARGTPRIRVAPPFLIDAQGARTEATLSIENCQVDSDPNAPWSRPVRDPGARACVLQIRWDEAGLVYPALLDPSWSTTGNMAVARAHHSAHRLSTGRILVAGGLTTGGVATKTA